MPTFRGLLPERLHETAEGLSVAVPRGFCEVDVDDRVVRLAWIEKDGRRTVTLTTRRFEELLEYGSIAIFDPGGRWRRSGGR